MKTATKVFFTLIKILLKKKKKKKIVEIANWAKHCIALICTEITEKLSQNSFKERLFREN